MHAPHVLANAGKRLAEGRVDDAPYHVKDQKQQNSDIDVIGMAEQIDSNRPSNGHISMPERPS